MKGPARAGHQTYWSYMRPFETSVDWMRAPVLVFVDLWRHSIGPLHLMFSYTLIKPTEWSQHVGKPPGLGQQCLILPAPRVWTNGHLLGFFTRSHGNRSFLWLWKGCGIGWGPVEVCQFWWWAGLGSSQRVFFPCWRRSRMLDNYKATRPACEKISGNICWKWWVAFLCN